MRNHELEDEAFVREMINWTNRGGESHLGKVIGVSLDLSQPPEREALKQPSSQVLRKVRRIENERLRQQALVPHTEKPTSRKILQSAIVFARDALV